MNYGCAFIVGMIKTHHFCSAEKAEEGIGIKLITGSEHLRGGWAILNVAEKGPPVSTSDIEHLSAQSGHAAKGTNSLVQLDESARFVSRDAHDCVNP